jgi:hypothetical protein
MGANFSERVAFLNEKVWPDGWFLTNSIVLAGLTNFGRVDYRESPAGFVPQAIMSGNYKHDYSQIRVPVLAFVGYPPLPQDEIRRNDATGPAEWTIIEAVFGVNVGLIKNRIKRINSAAGGAHVVELWGANHFVFLSNESGVLREIRIFLAGLH